MSNVKANTEKPKRDKYTWLQKQQQKLLVANYRPSIFFAFCTARKTRFQIHFLHSCKNLKNAQKLVQLLREN